MCLKLIELLRQKGVRCGGVVSREVREAGTRIGFEFVDVETGQTFVLASIRGKGPLVGKYHVDLNGIERAANILRQTPSDVIFVDELGPMEIKSYAFKEIVEELARGSRLLVLVVHGSLAKSYSCIEVTAGNRDSMPDDLALHITASL